MQEAPRTYRIQQLGRPDSSEVQANEPVSSLEDLVTHHPGANRRIRMEEGRIEGGENEDRRSYAFISGDFEEVIDARVDRYGSLGRDQVLLVKDFILEDPAPARGTSARAVDVPSPVDGYVTRVRDSGGMVEISDRPGGNVLARVRHLSELDVRVGETVVYGQTLGTQNNLGLGLRAGVAVHVHMEVDTRLYRQYENYLSDLSSGRLPVQAEHRQGVRPLPANHDGTFRLGESHPRIRELQQVMHREGYRAAGGGPLDQDGVYRPGMQGALLDFQRDHGLAQTGDIDAATLRFAPAARGRERDLVDHFQPGRPMPAAADPSSAPGHPDHPDHRPGLRPELEAPVNRSSGRSASAQLLDGLFAAARARNPDAFAHALSAAARSSEAQAMLDRGYASLDQAQAHAAAHEPQRIHETPSPG